MRHCLLYTLLIICTHSYGQRIVGKIVYSYSDPYSVDTITNGKVLKLTVSADTILDLGETKIFKITKVDKRQIELADSLIKADLLNAIVYMDSISFVTYMYDKLGHRMSAENFLAYKFKNSDRFKKQYKAEKKRQEKSDKYYSAYTKNGDTWTIVMFDPLKSKRRMMGDLVWFDYAEPILINLQTFKIYILGTQPR